MAHQLENGDNNDILKEVRHSVSHFFASLPVRASLAAIFMMQQSADLAHAQPLLPEKQQRMNVPYIRRTEDDDFLSTDRWNGTTDTGLDEKKSAAKERSYPVTARAQDRLTVVYALARLLHTQSMNIKPMKAVSAPSLERQSQRSSHRSQYDFRKGKLRK